MDSNRLLSPSMLEVAMAPRAWRVVATRCPPEVPVVDDPAHRRWMARCSHSHAHRELLLILSGRPHFGLQGTVFDSQPGTLFFLDAGESHDLEWPPWTPDSDHLWLGMIGPDLLGRVLSIRNGELSAQRTEYLSPEHVALVEGAWARTEVGGRELPADLQRMKLLTGAALLVAALAERGLTPEQPEADLQSRTVQAVQRYIERTAGRGVTLDAMARFSGYSKFHLARLFQRHTGLTVHQYVDQCRLRRARQMLEAGATQAAIALELGFSSPPSLCRWLRQQRERG